MLCSPTSAAPRPRACSEVANDHAGRLINSSEPISRQASLLQAANDESVARTDLLLIRPLGRQQVLSRNSSMLIDVTGTREGQVNGLSILELGDHAFDRPVRITAQ